MREHGSSWTAHAAAAASSVAFTLAASLLVGVIDPANMVMLYLLLTMGVALRWGRGPAALAAVLNVLAFDFVFVPPHLSLAVRDVQYLITFGVMLAVGLVTGQLTAGLRRQAQIAGEVASERLRNTLLSAISHDLRTPLTALVGLAESLRRSQPPLSPAQADTADAIAAQAMSLAQLAHNLLDLARLQAGPAQLRLDWGSLEEVVGSALRGVQPPLPREALQVRLPPALPLVRFDAVLLERVLVNLVENAAKYGAPPIEIGAEVRPAALRVWVRDHGRGLPGGWKGREQELFDKFIRGDRESSTPGAGLGLAICKAVVEAHGGRIAATDAPGGGAAFTFELPRHTPPADPA